MPRRKQIKPGSIFHWLTVIDEAPPRFTPRGIRIYRVKALCGICGNIAIVAEYDLRRGHAKSCGCFNVYSRVKHLSGSTPTYSSWAAMWNRCTNSKNKDYPRYGALGISVCKRWKDFQVFAADMGERPSGTSIDRYPDPYGNYEPLNCRWATPKEQANNRRRHIK